MQEKLEAIDYLMGNDIFRNGFFFERNSDPEFEMVRTNKNLRKIIKNEFSRYSFKKYRWFLFNSKH